MVGLYNQLFFNIGGWNKLHIIKMVEEIRCYNATMCS